VEGAVARERIRWVLRPWVLEASWPHGQGEVALRGSSRVHEVTAVPGSRRRFEVALAVHPAELVRKDARSTRTHREHELLLAGGSPVNEPLSAKHDEARALRSTSSAMMDPKPHGVWVLV